VWRKLVLVLVVGYTTMTRSFNYMGIPSLNLFLGEVALGAFVFFRAREVLGVWSSALARRSPLSGLSWALFLFFAYGIMQVWYGIAVGNKALTALRDFAFNYYPFYLFLGLWVGCRSPETLRSVLRVLAWVNGVYGMLYVLVLSRLGWTMPWAPNVDAFGQPLGSAVAILGLAAFEGARWRALVPYLLNLGVLLAIQVRAEWVGLLIGISLWIIFTGRVRTAVVTAASLLMLLGILHVTKLSISGPRGTISAASIVARGLAPLSEEAAGKLSDQAESHAGTVKWRQGWWDAIWVSVHEDTRRKLLGHGYGYPLYSLEPHIPDIRTPHSLFYYALGYGGWVGVGVLLLIHVALARLLWRVAVSTGEPFGVAYWGLGIAISLFGNFFETPFGAIPFYLLIGLVLGRWSAVAGASGARQNDKMPAAQRMFTGSEARV
jgi:hypothetical protein